MGATVEGEIDVADDDWDRLRVGNWRFGELSVKKITGLLCDRKGGIDL